MNHDRDRSYDGHDGLTVLAARASGAILDPAESRGVVTGRWLEEQGMVGEGSQALRSLRARSDVRAESTGHIALVGFMGSGKTTVGRALAERLGMAFADLDEYVAERVGRSIAEIFRDEGETGFRARERAALRELLTAEPAHVIATGGGTFIDPKLRQALRAVTQTIYLEASLELVQHRLLERDARKHRPLLNGPNPELTLRRLFKERASAYRESELVISVDGLDCEAIVERALLALGLAAPRKRGRGATVSGPAESRPLRAARSDCGKTDSLSVAFNDGYYPVLFEEKAGRWIAEAVSAKVRGRRIALITDDNVAPLYAQALHHALKAQNKQSYVHVVPAGESSKSLGQASQLYDALLRQELDREDAVVALGGGVVGDLAGFVASTFLRGIDLIQVPTTTLACVDSSVGGKTGVNTPRGKNLVGSFHRPRLVCIAADYLRTLPPRQHAAGLAEVVKIAACLDPELFSNLASGMEALIEFEGQTLLSTIRRSVALKAAIVEEDEKERGVRAVLNFGHTIGHAIEKGLDFGILHGEAVALGMVAEAEWADSEGLSSGMARALEGVLASAGLPVDWRNRRVDLAAIRLDKKRAGVHLTLPVVRSIGQFEFKTVPVSAVSEFVSQRSFE